MFGFSLACMNFKFECNVICFLCVNVSVCLHIFFLNIQKVISVYFRKHVKFGGSTYPENSRIHLVRMVKSSPLGVRRRDGAGVFLVGASKSGDKEKVFWLVVSKIFLCFSLAWGHDPA